MIKNIIARCSAAFATALMIRVYSGPGGHFPVGCPVWGSECGWRLAGLWPNFGHQHYSPLRQIDARNVGRLELAWSRNLEPLRNTATEPIEIGGVLYFASGLSVVHAVNAASGRLLWRYDPTRRQKPGSICAMVGAFAVSPGGMARFTRAPSMGG